MTEPRHLAELEYEQFRRWLLRPDPPQQFADPANRRLVDVFAARRAGRASDRELAVVLRQHVRRWAIHRGENQPLTVAADLIPAEQNAVFADVGLIVVRDGSRAFISARQWDPTWLSNPLDVPTDESAAAGTSTGWRRRDAELRADDAFRSATSFSTYRTPGQRDAVRMALEMNPRGVMIANLPTGSGKTEIVITLARSFGDLGGGTVVMVVPTVALAQDLEDRFQLRWSELVGRDLSDVPFAWTNATPPQQRTQIRSRLMSGQQPILVTSPESLNGPLLEATKIAAGNGRLRALVIDEAHLITQWGRSFRPDFRLLGPLWGELNELSERGVRALLMSATIGPEVVEDLCSAFHSDAGPWVVAANALRQEPRMWVGPYEGPRVRDQRVLEALDHLPRPCILYVTQPQTAKSWVRRLSERGYRRVTMVTGDSSAEDRSRALRGLRTARGSSEFDIVVATSAFGLGVDADEIRCIVHACLPETADRWYQEVGRGGRDGYASTSLLLPALGDVEEAMKLGVDVLSPDIAKQRWSAMWLNRETIDGEIYVNLRHSPPGKQDGSYNRRWNSQTLDGLEQLRVLERTPLSFDETHRLGLDRPGPPPRIPNAWSRVAMRDHVPGAEFFARRWDDWKESIDQSSRNAFETMVALTRSQDACRAVNAAYAPNTASISCVGEDVAGGFSVTYPCGRCQNCARSDRPPLSDPAPDPRIRWASDIQTSAFHRFVDENTFVLPSRGSIDRVCVVECDEFELLSLAPALARSGVRYACGQGIAEAAHEFTYFDPYVQVLSILPMAAVIAVPDVAELQQLLHQLPLRLESVRDGVGPVLVQTPEVPRELRAQRPVSASDVRRGVGA